MAAEPTKSTRLKIVSDGTYFTTKVMTEDGQVIDGVTSITWTIGPYPEGVIGKAVIHVELASVDVETDAELVTEAVV